MNKIYLLLLLSFLSLGVSAKTLPQIFSKITIKGKNYQQTSETNRFFPVIFPTSNGKEHIVEITSQKTTEGAQYQIFMRVEEDIDWESITIHIPYVFLEKDKIFANGFQSWTGSKEMDIQEKRKKLIPIFPKVLQTSGDYLFAPKEDSRHAIMGWMYGYVRQSNNEINLFASKNEANGYTQIVFDIENNEILLRKDLEGVKHKAGNTIANICTFYIGNGNERAVFSDYFSHLSLPTIANIPQSGWTSWYQYYTNISEAICLDNLATFKKNKIPLDYFQLDDGWQHAVGDWLEVNNKFPSGIKGLAEKIHQSGYQSGLWLAPFICEQKSDIFLQHKDWILRDSKGKMVKAGFNPGWSGNFYALNFYHPEVQNYLRKVFQTVLQDWKVDFVKLDFLYAVAQIPQQGKSRGEIMNEAMRFLREICGDKKILGCGVPLSATIGTVDFCRIGPDVGLTWEWNLEKHTHFREMVSTKWATLNTIHRRNLHAQLFLNDPDVFNLRENDNKLTENQSHSIFLLNQILGGILFTSDHIGHYNDTQKRVYLSQFPVLPKEMIDIVALISVKKEGDNRRKSEIIYEKPNEILLFNEDQNQTNTVQEIDISIQPSAEKVYLISFYLEKNHYLSLVNLTSKSQKIHFPYNNYIWLNPENDRPLLYNQGDGITLAPYESRIFKYVDDKANCLVSDNLHLFPTSEMLSFSVENHQILLTFHPDFRQEKGIIWLQVADEKAYIFEGKSYFPEEMNGRWWVKIDK